MTRTKSNNTNQWSRSQRHWAMESINLMEWWDDCLGGLLRVDEMELVREVSWSTIGGVWCDVAEYFTLGYQDGIVWKPTKAPILQIYCPRQRNKWKIYCRVWMRMSWPRPKSPVMKLCNRMWMTIWMPICVRLWMWSFTRRRVNAMNSPLLKQSPFRSRPINAFERKLEKDQNEMKLRHRIQNTSSKGEFITVSSVRGLTPQSCEHWQRSWKANRQSTYKYDGLSSIGDFVRDHPSSPGLPGSCETMQLPDNDIEIWGLLSTIDYTSHHPECDPMG